MIRVNLLPVRKARRRSRGLIQLLLFFGVIVFQIVLLAATYFYFAVDRDDLQSTVKDLEAEVERLEQDTEELDRLQAEAAQLQEQYDVLAALENRRVGPVPMLDELQQMLTPAVGAAEQQIAARRGWDPSWEPRRVWLDSFAERDEGTFGLDGQAADTDDVAQFLQRMTNATYFTDVELDYIQQQGNHGLVSFHMYGNYDYSGFDDADDDQDS